MSTTTATTEAIAHGIHHLSIKHHDYTTKDKYNHSDYYSDDDQTSEVTVTTVKDSIHHKSPITTVTNQDWLDEIEHSFDNNSTYQNNDNSDFYDHQSIIQSYLEPATTTLYTPSNTTTTYTPSKSATYTPSSKSPLVSPIHTSKFSIMKSRMKRVFGISSNKESLPIISTHERWAPSIDSACSSTITTAATIRDTSSIHSVKNYNRHSCGLSTASFKSNTKPTEHEQEKKSILKKQQYDLDQKRKRWSRISIMAKPSKRLSVIMLKRKKSSKEMFINNNNENEGRVKFNKYVHVHETWAKGEYDRSSDPDAVCTRLTTSIAQQIKQELNHFKLHEMSVHDSSRIHTHFFL